MFQIILFLVALFRTVKQNKTSVSGTSTKNECFCLKPTNFTIPFILLKFIRNFVNNSANEGVRDCQTDKPTKKNRKKQSA